MKITCLFLSLVFALALGQGLHADPAPAPLIDVDQLASRFKSGGDLYASIRDQSLATYAKLHPAPSDYDPQAKTAIRLAAYLRVWGDFYGEGLWAVALDQARQAISGGSTDSLILALQPIHTMEGVKSSDNDLAAKIDEKANNFAATDYPHAFKLWLYTLDIRNLAGTKKNNQLKDEVAALLPKAVENSVNEYGELLKAKANPEFMATAGHALFHAIQSDEESLKLSGAKLDQIFAKTEPDSALHDFMQGDYMITWAWNARGTGYANTLTAQGVSLFDDRLKKAADILTAAYAKHPDAGMISREMLTVELGQNNGREDMELWFGRAMKANPDDYTACLAKGYYLSPQWHGSDDDIWNFGVECAQTQNWSGKIPMVLVDLTVSYLWKKHPENFTDEKKWDIFQTTFHGYFERFPNSIYYRSIYARWAAESGHFVESEEQFKILGDKWDREVFPGGRYEEMRGKADAGVAGASTPTPVPK